MVSYKVLFLVFFSNFVHQGYCALPVVVSSAVVSGDGSDTCPPQSSIDAQLNATKAQIRQAITNTVNLILDGNFSPGSCNGTGWTRVALLNMTDPDEVCPSSLSMLTSPVRGCGRQSASAGCDAVLFNIVPVQGYSDVCGRILAYQRGSPDAFYPFIEGGQTTIDSAYVDGVSLTHGPAGSRQHIWTFAAALNEQNSNLRFLCPCITSSWPYQVPAFIGSNYFCETGNPSGAIQFTPFYLDDPLWDGEGCGSNSRCCQFNDPPWFQTELPLVIRDGVELRLCHDEPSTNEDVIITLIEIYVK